MPPHPQATTGRKKAALLALLSLVGMWEDCSSLFSVVLGPCDESDLGTLSRGEESQFQLEAVESGCEFSLFLLFASMAVMRGQSHKIDHQGPVPWQLTRLASTLHEQELNPGCIKLLRFGG